ncbi:MAG: protein kinase domain-containing protein [Terriglobales bacterium]
MLSPGTRLGPYEILAPLGEGGMGEVYRARDSRLDRTVALKVLSGKLDATPEMHGRFEREARAVAALQHPNICILHDVGRDSGTAYLVMEYLEGETLAARLRRGKLALAEIIAIGGQVAAALERAHRAGIVHRDLKPANIMLLSGSGQPQIKLLDFGLAKQDTASAIAATWADTPTAPAATRAGAVLGTIPYMAPEQLEGREADARSDLYAFGCVLYEMASGEPAYRGTRAVEPPALHRLIGHCLAHNPDERVQSAHDAGLMLRAAGEAAGPVTAPAPPRRRWLGYTAAAAAVLVAAAAGWWLRPQTAPVLVAAVIPAPAGTHLILGGTDPGTAAISPNGRWVVFGAQAAGGRRSLWLRALGSPQARELAGSETGFLPFWSPDSSAIGFFTHGGLEGGGYLVVLNLAGGLPRVLVPSGEARGGTWAPDGTVLFAADVTGTLSGVPASGGAVRPVASLPPGYSSLRFPYFLPDGRHFLCLAISHDDPGKDMLYFGALDGTMRPLLHAVTGAIFASGNLLYSAGGVLTAQPMNPATGALSGQPRAVAQNIYDDDITWRPGYSASNTGVLVYASGSAGAQQMAWVDRKGQLEPPMAAYSGTAATAAVSPNGQLLAVSLDQGVQDLWIGPASGATRTRLTFGPIASLYPVWSPDGRELAYGTMTSAGQKQLAVRPAGGGAQTVLRQSPGGGLAPAAWSPDGREILCWSKQGLVAFPTEGGPLRPVTNPAGMQITRAALSSDGRWASYLAAEPGQGFNLYVVPFRGGTGAVWQVTTFGVANYFWSRGGGELDVEDDNARMLAIAVGGTSEAPTFGAPVLLAANFPALLAATADGQHFLATTHPDDHERLMVMTHWAAARP